MSSHPWETPEDGEEPDLSIEDESPQGVESKMRRRLDQAFRTALVIIPIGVLGNIAFSLWFTDRALLNSVLSLPKTSLLFAVGLGIFPWFTNALRMWIWMRFLGHQLSYRESFRIALGSDLGAAVSPVAVGGGFFKWGMLVQRGVSLGAAASLSALTYIEDGIFFIIAIPLAIVISASWHNPIFGTIAGQFRQNALPVVVLGGLIALGSWLAARWVLGGGLGMRTQHRTRHLLDRIRGNLHTHTEDARTVYRLIRKNGKARFLLSLTFTSFQWISRYSIISVLIGFLGAPVQPVLFWLLQWVVFTLAAFIPTPGGAGVAEAAFFLVYSPFVPGRIIGLATAGWRFFTFYLLLAMAAVLYVALGAARASDTPSR